MYMISVPVYLLSRVNPVWIFKIMGPILYGTMIAALFRFLRLGLKWPDKQALGGALLTSLYFVTLRVSWDMYRNMLGLTFILLSLPLLGAMRGRRSQVFLAALVVLAAASDQLTGVIALSLIGARALEELARRGWGEFTRLVRVGIPGLLFFLSVAYAGVILPGESLAQQQPLVPGLDSIVSSAGFLGYIYLPIAPLVILGMRRAVNVDLRNWTVVLTCLSLAALVSLSGFIVMSYRWSLLLDIPLCVYASAGIARIMGTGRPDIDWSGLLRGKILPIFSVVLVVSATVYIIVPAQNAMLYYSAFPSFLPTSMVQDTVPVSDMAYLRMTLDWVQSNMRPDTVLIAHQAIYGWARAYLPSSDHIISYGYLDPVDGASLARSMGYSTVWTLWWTPGLGLHGQATLPTSFASIFQDGNIAVYIYQ
jgi:hypothetical protein